MWGVRGVLRGRKGVRYGREEKEPRILLMMIRRKREKAGRHCLDGFWNELSANRRFRGESMCTLWN